MQLQNAGVLEPWEIKVKKGDGIQSVEGLYRVNEGKLNKLPAEEFMLLRDSGALVLAYCQLLSIRNNQTLGRLSSQLLSLQNTSKNSPQSIESYLSEDSGTISFEGL